jgi:hypothetical protein
MMRLGRGALLSEKEKMDFEILWPFSASQPSTRAGKHPQALGPILGALLPKPFVVDSEAAIIGGTYVYEKVIELDTDHARMNKFASADDPLRG